MTDKAKILADWIIKNNHACPFGDDPGFDVESQCAGFREPGCADCVLAHAALLAEIDRTPLDAVGNDLSSVKPGDHILYQNGTSFELGRIKSINFEARVAYVWYSEGDTAARTPFDSLIRLTNGYVCAGTNLGGSAYKNLKRHG